MGCVTRVRINLLPLAPLGGQGVTQCPRSPPCDLLPCALGATCVETGGDNFTCLCAAGQTGRLCDVSDDACLSNPCADGSTCVAEGPGSRVFECHCPLGISGRFCNESKPEILFVNECFVEIMQYLLQGKDGL